MTVVLKTRPQRILDLDIEARPLHWIADDYVSREITAMAWAWTTDPTAITCVLLGHDDPVAMLTAFRHAFDQADLVTGHFIRGYDLPNINGALMEYHLPALTDKLTHDTKLDLVKRQGLSMSQENLSALLRLEQDKVRMNQTKWRAANRLTPAGLEDARQRVMGDVAQHMELRQRLLALGYLGNPRIWRSASATTHYLP